MKEKLNQLLQQFQTTFLFNSAAVFFGVGVSDFIWTKYMGAVAERSTLAGASWSAALIFISAFVTVSYVKDRRLIVAATLGAFVGTYLGI